MKPEYAPEAGGSPASGPRGPGAPGTTPPGPGREADGERASDGGPDAGQRIALLGQMACLVELAAPNPGNVRPGRDLPGLTSLDLMMSAAAVGPALADAGRASPGEIILRAVEETRRWVDTNTNLGIVLLFAPVARAAALAAAGAPTAGSADGTAGPDGGASPGEAGRSGGRERPAGGADLQGALEAVLASTTVRDAELAYRAIRTAEPGGMGRVPEQDVSGTPTVTLGEAMRRAADRDAVAEQYATGYRLLRSVGVPSVRSAREEGLGWPESAHRCFTRLLAERPDSLIARRFGRAEAESVREEARRLEEAGPPEGPEEAAGWEELDRRLRSASPPRNPGTTADLTAAALFLALLGEAGWNYPADEQ